MPTESENLVEEAVVLLYAVVRDPRQVVSAFWSAILRELRDQHKGLLLTSVR